MVFSAEEALKIRELAHRTPIYLSPDGQRIGYTVRVPEQAESVDSVQRPSIHFAAGVVQELVGSSWAARSMCRNWKTNPPASSRASGDQAGGRAGRPTEITSFSCLTRTAGFAPGSGTPIKTRPGHYAMPGSVRFSATTFPYGCPTETRFSSKRK